MLDLNSELKNYDMEQVARIDNLQIGQELSSIENLLRNNTNPVQVQQAISKLNNLSNNHDIPISLQMRIQALQASAGVAQAQALVNNETHEKNFMGISTTSDVNKDADYLKKIAELEVSFEKFAASYEKWGESFLEKQKEENARLQGTIDKLQAGESLSKEDLAYLNRPRDLKKEDLTNRRGKAIIKQKEDNIVLKDYHTKQVETLKSHTDDDIQKSGLSKEEHGKKIKYHSSELEKIEAVDKNLDEHINNQKLKLSKFAETAEHVAKGNVDIDTQEAIRNGFIADYRENYMLNQEITKNPNSEDYKQLQNIINKFGISDDIKNINEEKQITTSKVKTEIIEKEPAIKKEGNTRIKLTNEQQSKNLKEYKVLQNTGPVKEEVEKESAIKKASNIRSKLMNKQKINKANSHHVSVKNRQQNGVRQR